MQIYTDRRFDTLYKKLTFQQKDLLDATIELFRENPHHPSLRTHTLRDELAGYWSFSIDEDLRVLFSQKGNFQEVLLIKVGNHDTVYQNPIF